MRVSAYLLNESRRLEPSSFDAFSDAEANEGPWLVDVEQPEAASFKELLAPLDLHPLVIESCLEANGPLVAPYSDAVFLQLPLQLAWDREDQGLLSLICLSKGVIITHTTVIPQIERLIQEGLGAARYHERSAPAILFFLLDRLIDEDMSFVLYSRRAVDNLTDQFETGKENLDTGIALELKRKLMHLAGTLEDQLYCVTALQTLESDVFNISTLREYFHESLSNLEHTVRSAGRQQQRLQGLYQQGLLELQEITNWRLRILTIISAVFLPMTLVAGIYGMNFRYMPELGWRYGYPMALGLMFAIAASLLLFFHRKGWFK